MLPQINNKPILNCTEEDFKVLLHNPDYRENQFLDYKKDFAFLKVPKEKSEQIAVKIIEFRNDICSFANAEGGYIIYGISDEQGTADEIVGVDIDNPDKFELDLRNRLIPIMPKVPPVQFQFVPLNDGRYLVVIFIDHDYYAPYLHVEDQKNYKIYKREGNQKAIVGYTELKNMFIQSRVLEDEILGFRKKRIDYLKSLEDTITYRFLLFHMIPESFLNERKSLFLLERTQKHNLRDVFSEAKIDSFSLPCVDGLRYENTYGDERAILYNNGIAEYMLPLGMYVAPQNDGTEWYFADDVWGYVDAVSRGYQTVMPDIFGNQRYFACISIIGCKDAATESNGYGRHVTKIDRNEIICQPIVFQNIENADSFYESLNRLHLEYLRSVGIKRDNTVKELINAIEGQHEK